MKAVISKKNAVERGLESAVNTAQGAVQGAMKFAEQRNLVIAQREERMKNQAEFDADLRRLQAEANEGRLSRAQQIALAESQMAFDEYKTKYQADASLAATKAELEQRERENRRAAWLRQQELKSMEQRHESELDATQRGPKLILQDEDSAAAVLRNAGLDSKKYAELSDAAKLEYIKRFAAARGYDFSQNHDWVKDSRIKQWDDMLKNSDAVQAKRKEDLREMAQLEAEMKAGTVQSGGRQSSTGAGTKMNNGGLAENQFAGTVEIGLNSVADNLFARYDKAMEGKGGPTSGVKFARATGVYLDLSQISKRDPGLEVMNTRLSAMLDRAANEITTISDTRTRGTIAQQKALEVSSFIRNQYGPSQALTAEEKEILLKSIPEMVLNLSKPTTRITPEGYVGDQVFATPPKPAKR